MGTHNKSKSYVLKMSPEAFSETDGIMHYIKAILSDKEYLLGSGYSVEEAWEDASNNFRTYFASLKK